MPKMVALKDFRYPRGRDGTDLKAGDEFEVQTDREAKALRLLKIAKDPEGPPPKEQPQAPEGSGEARPKRERKPYRRSDMEVE